MMRGHADHNLMVNQETSIYDLSKIFTTAKEDDIIMRITCNRVRKIIL
jgi:hypothetical protein